MFNSSFYSISFFSQFISFSIFCVLNVLNYLFSILIEYRFGGGAYLTWSDFVVTRIFKALDNNQSHSQWLAMTAFQKLGHPIYYIISFILFPFNCIFYRYLFCILHLCFTKRKEKLCCTDWLGTLWSSYVSYP